MASASAAQAPQDGSPDPNSVRVRIGPVWLNPTIALPNIGIDTNVFNDPPSVTPKRDFTITVAPKAELWLRMGRTWFTSLVSEEMIWYQKYTSERSTNSAYTVGWKAPLNHLVLSTSASWLRTRARPGFEIDTRAQRNEPTYTGSVEVRGFPKTFIGVRGSWNQVRFDQNANFKGENLQEQLDRTNSSAAITLRHELTPLTSITFSAGRSEQRFATAISRNATSRDYTATVTFDPAALLKGSASVGYMQYEPESADLPAFHGVMVSTGLTYTLQGSTRFAGTIRRGVDFSYDIGQPYYVLTSETVSISQQIFGPVDVVGRAGAQHMAYRTRVDAIVAAPDRVDRMRSYGLGVGFRMGQDLRLGFNFDKERRLSILEDRQYNGMKYGASITYGIER